MAADPDFEPPHAPGAQGAPRFQAPARPTYGGYAPPRGAAPARTITAGGAEEAPRAPAPGSRSSGDAGATLALVLGITGIAIFALFGFGLLAPANLGCSLAALLIARRALRDPAAAQAGRTGRAAAARTLGIVGLAIGVAAVIAWSLFFVLDDDPLRTLEIDVSDEPGIQLED